MVPLAGIEDSINSSDPNDTKDFYRALSLLSTNSWGSYEAKSTSLEHSNHTSAAQPATHAAPSEYWNTDQPLNSSMWISYSNSDDNNRFHEFQLFREPYGSGFTHDQLD